MLSEELIRKVMENAPGRTAYDPELEWLNEYAPLREKKHTTVVTVELTSGVAATVTIRFE